MNAQRNSRYFLFLSIIVFLFILIGVEYKILNRKFQDDFECISNHAYKLEYQLLFVGFFDDFFRYPLSLDELFDYYKKDSSYLEKVKTVLKDPFSRNHDYLRYLPIYSNLSELPEGYLLISAGTDGYLEPLKLDTIYFENLNELKFYNNLEQMNFLSSRRYSLSFSILEYFNGQKDFLIENTDGISKYLNNCRNRVYSPSMLMQRLFPYSLIKRMDCTVEGDVREFSRDTLIVYDGLTAVICAMYKGREYNINNFGNVNIAGQYKHKIDPLHRVIFLDNCILVDKSDVPPRAMTVIK